MFFHIPAICIAATTISAFHVFAPPASAWPAGTKNEPTTELTKGKIWSAGETCDKYYHGVEMNSYYGDDKKLDRDSIDGENNFKNMHVKMGNCDCKMHDNCDDFKEVNYKARFLGIFPKGDDW